MAIFHCSAQVISRGDNRNAVAAAAYRSGTSLTAEIVDKETGIIVERTFDYNNKANVNYSEILAPQGAPKWVHDRSLLWNEVERVEKRHDSQLSRELDVAFPKELSFEQSKELLREYVNICFVEKGMIADLSIHWEENNPHAHIMLTMRELHKHGFGKKVREWNSKSLLNETRELWAYCVNSHLEKNGFDERVDHRSYKDRDIELTPTMHEGVEEGVDGWKERVEENERIREDNLLKIKADPTIILKKLSSGKATFTHEDIAKEVFNLTLGKEEYFHGIYRKAIECDSIKVVDTGEAGEAEPTTSASSSNKQMKTRFVFKDYAQTEQGLWRNLAALERGDGLGVGSDRKEHRVVLTLSQGQALETKYEGLSPEQKEAVAVLTGRDLGVQGSRSSVSVLIGRAGTGKTTTLKAVADYYRESGYTVKGGAISGIASDSLGSIGATGDSNNPGIESKTLAKWFKDIESGWSKFTDKDVFIVDEASMVDTDDMHKLTELTLTSKSKLILVGDNTQIQTIGKGGAFRGVLNQLEPHNLATLSKVWRQKNASHRVLTEKMARGEVREVIEAYERLGCIKESDTRQGAITALVREYVKDCRDEYTIYANPNSTKAGQKEQKERLILTYTSEAADRINKAVRSDLKLGGLLGDEKQYLSKNGYIDVAVGDKLLFLENSWALNVRNGQGGKVVKLKSNSITLELNTNNNANTNSRTVSFNIKDYNNINHGYAVTTHKAQGRTVDKAYVLTETYHNFNSLNVAITRHRGSLSIHTNKEAHATLDHLIYNIEREDYKDLLSDYKSYDEMSNEERSIKGGLDKYLCAVEDCKIYYSEISAWATKHNKGFTEHKKWGKYLASIKHREQLAKTMSNNKDAYKPVLMQNGISASVIDRHAGKIKMALSTEERNSRDLVRTYGKLAETSSLRAHELAYVISKDVPKYSRYFGEYKIARGHDKIAMMRSTASSYVGSIEAPYASSTQHQQHQQQHRQDQQDQRFELLNLTEKLAIAESGVLNSKSSKALLDLAKADLATAESFSQDVSAKQTKRDAVKTDIANLNYKKELLERGMNNPKQSEQLTQNTIATSKLEKRLDGLETGLLEAKGELHLSNRQLGDFANNPDSARRTISAIEESLTKVAEKTNEVKEQDKQNATETANTTESVELKQSKQREYTSPTKATNRSTLSARDLHDRFTTPGNIKSLAENMFGKSNEKLSTSTELRFGENGKIIMNLGGDKAGMWFDFSRDEGGNLYTLLREERGLDTVEAKEYLLEFMGLSQEGREAGRADKLDRVDKAEKAEKVEGKEKADDLKHNDASAPDKDIIKAIDKKHGFNEEKQRRVQQVIGKTSPIKGTIAADYLEKHRDIDLSKIKLSNDIRFSKETYSSEDKRGDHHALVAVARNWRGDARAVQSIYLDTNTSNKDKNLDIQKRSQGQLKGCFVELTRNKFANRVYITEGIETGLSIAQAAPKARVICTLGISNMKNIDLSGTEMKGKEIILCADNDTDKQNTENTRYKSTRETIETAGRNIKAMHDVKHVAIITPEKPGQDFNDVLREEGIEKLQKHLEPFEGKLAERRDEAKKDIIRENIYKNRAIYNIKDVYDDSAKAIEYWHELVSEYGLKEVEDTVRDDPRIIGALKGSNFIGIKDKERIYADQNKNKVWRSFSIVTEAIESQHSNRAYLDSLHENYIRPLSHTDISGMDRASVEQCYEKLILNASSVMEGKRDFEVIKDLSSRISTEVEDYKVREGREPDSKALFGIVNAAFENDNNNKDTRDQSKDNSREYTRDQEKDRDADRDRSDMKTHDLKHQMTTEEKQEKSLSKNLDMESTVEECSRQTRTIEIER
jgi:Ti-type conjugative transfer relaxase TraA